MKSTIQIVPLKPKYAKALEDLQTICYPTLGYQERMREEHFLRHYELFPEADLIALEGETVVGLGSGFFIDFDFNHSHHTFQEIIAEGYYSHHDPKGEWYYGADISVHPQHRGKGIGKLLYKARKDLVKRYNRHGIIAGGLIPDYAKHKNNLDPKTYVEKVIAGELLDSTLSFQLKNGFTFRGLLENYIEDSASDNWATLIVWENPDYHAD
jgi:GNAT superfamily N-acetyltransferase